MTIPVVGQPITDPAELDRLPPDSIIEVVSRTSEWYTKRADGMWYMQNMDGIGNLPRSFTMGGYNRVRSVGEGATPPVESLAQYVWRYRQVVMVGAEENSIRRDTVENALAEMGWPTDSLPLGTGLLVRSRHDRDLLPNGSTVRVGDPSDHRRLGIYAKGGRNNWHLVFGENEVNVTTGSQTIVLTVGGQVVRQPWIDTPGTPQSEAEIIAFKARAYRIGKRIQAAHDWCGTYNRIVEQAGVTQTAVRQAARLPVDTSLPPVGTRIDKLGIADLPVGTVLRWRSQESPQTREIWYMRVDDAGNEAGTRRLFGWRDDRPVTGHFARNMEILDYARTNPGEPHQMYLIPVTDNEHVFANMPVGTLFEYSDQIYVMCEDRRAIDWMPGQQRHQARGRHNLADFGGAPVFTIVNLERPTS